MMWLRLSILAFFVVGCDGSQATEFREFVPLAEGFVEAAAAGDTVTMKRLCEADRPVRWALEQRASEPQFWADAAGNLKFLQGQRLGDVGVQEIAIVEFAFPYSGKQEPLGFQFLRVGDTWKITQVQPMNR